MRKNFDVKPWFYPLPVLIIGYLDTWENVSFDDKRRVVDLMITTIAATSDSLNITWKI